MSERTGVGVVAVAILEALETSQFRVCAKALDRVEERIGLAPGYAYQVLVDMAQPWTLPLPLLEGHGNFGSRGDDPPANFRYTEARISRAGRVALAAERGEIPPVPIGLINGNTHRGGLRPPFRPSAVIDAMRQVIARPDVTDKELTALVGPPCFPVGCAVTGNLAGLAAGRHVELRLEAQVSIGEDRRAVIVEHIPPNITTDEAARMIVKRAGPPRGWAADHPRLHLAARLPLREVRDETSEQHRFGRIICIPEPDTSPGQLRDMLLDSPGVYTTMRAALPRPLPVLIRQWAQAGSGEELLAIS